jgi:hypothetical protein
VTGAPAELLPVIGAAVDTFAWTVLDVGRNARLAADLATEGIPVLSVTGRDGTCRIEPVSGSGSRPGDRLDLDPSLWAGATPASWGRATRRRVCIDLAARLTTVLSRELAGTRR